jgi:hypothetical protein
VPTGTTGNREVIGPGSTNAANTNADASTIRIAVHGYATVVNYTNPRNSTTLQVWSEEKAIVSVGSTAGNVTLMWGQWTANATGSLINANSYVKYRRIG